MTERFKLIPAVYVVLRRGDQVLLSRRANTGYQDGMLSLVAGHLDGNETASTAMVREAAEETGITITLSDLHFAHLAHRLNRDTTGQERIDIFFTCETWVGEPENLEPEKCSELVWVPLNQLPDDVIPLIRIVLEHVKNDVKYSEHRVEPTN